MIILTKLNKKKVALNPKKIVIVEPIENATQIFLDFNNCHNQNSIMVEEDFMTIIDMLKKLKK